MNVVFVAVVMHPNCQPLRVQSVNRYVCVCAEWQRESKNKWIVSVVCAAAFNYSKNIIIIFSPIFFFFRSSSTSSSLHLIRCCLFFQHEISFFSGILRVFAFWFTSIFTFFWLKNCCILCVCVTGSYSLFGSIVAYLFSLFLKNSIFATF